MTRRSTPNAVRLSVASAAVLGLLLAASANAWGTGRAQAQAMPPVAARAIVQRLTAAASPSTLLRGAATAALELELWERPSARPEPKPKPQTPVYRPSLLARIPHDIAVTSRPGGGQVVGVFPAGSKYYHVPLVAWILERTSNGRYGKVVVPYTWPQRQGWIPLHGLQLSTTRVMVHASLSQHRITITVGTKVVFRTAAATGSSSSPTPPGRYVVTDRVPFSGGALGTFAFGISGIQPHLPYGWSGGNQLAIHGTSAPWSIGTSASAGCLRVSEYALSRLKPLLALGTPVVIDR